MLFGVLHFDLFGFEKRVPSIEDVVSVSFTNENPNNDQYISYVNGKRAIPQETYLPNLTKEDDIANVIRFHRYKTDLRLTDEDSNPFSAYIQYHLKNGKTLLRQYPLNYSDDSDYLKPIMETKEFLGKHFPLLDDTKKNIISVSVEDDRLRSSFNTYFSKKASDVDISNKIIDALKKSCGAGEIRRVCLRSSHTDPY